MLRLPCYPARVDRDRRYSDAERSRRTHSLELRIPPLLVVVIFAASMAGVTYALPSMSIDIPARTLMAAGFFVLGAVVAGAAVLAFHHHKTTVNPLTPERSSVLVASGIYRLSRNPMYLGFLLGLVGWGVYLANVAAVLLLVLFILYMNRYQIEPEERALLDKFGGRFVEYSAAVRRWV